MADRTRLDVVAVVLVAAGFALVSLFAAHDRVCGYVCVGVEVLVVVAEVVCVRRG